MEKIRREKSTMEKLKSAIPNNLNRTISDAIVENLPLSSSSLLDFLLHFPPFHQIIDELVERSDRGPCEKNRDEASQLKAIANQKFSAGDYFDAWSSYSQALLFAPMDSDESGRNLVATLYLNRAFVFHKMGFLPECVRDCTRAIKISPSYAKAWFKRGTANASLGNYKEAINDLNVAKTVESSSGGKARIENELKSVLDQAGRKTITPPIEQIAQNSCSLDEPPKIQLQCVSTPDKARGMASASKICPGSLVHTEEPFAAIILRSYRETHCHYCFNELPIDKVPCTSCSISIYCSMNCQLLAGGTLCNYSKNICVPEKLSDNLENYVAEIISGDDLETVTEHFPEHKHECQSGSWPLVLPPSVVLAGRILVRSMMGTKGSPEIVELAEILKLAHHYSQMPSDTKLELHINSIVLLHCLKRSGGLKIQINGQLIAQVIILICQIKVNSMSIVRVKSTDVGLIDQHAKSPLRALTSTVEQVKVGQAIYKTGSLFNHSCLPNVHAYFLSRTLFVRTTEVVPAGCSLEVSYGPQVGQWDCHDRNMFLEDEYLFHCQCSGCSESNLSDLVLNAFHCIKPDCPGVVLNRFVLDCEKHKIRRLNGRASTSTSNPHFKVGNSRNDGINEVAGLLSNNLSDINPGHCLKCGSYRDLESSIALINEYWESISRLEHAIASDDLSDSKILDALRSLDSLKLTLHSDNRKIAEVEDILAQAFCLVGELELAMDHCKASIKILEKLYSSNHIVIGHELVKLVSIQLPLADSGVVDSINKLSIIFSCYYGLHADRVFPPLKLLKKEVSNDTKDLLNTILETLK